MSTAKVGMEAELVTRKGDVISIVKPWNIASLLPPIPDDTVKSLPRYCEFDPVYRDVAASHIGPLQSFVAEMARSKCHQAFSIVATFDVVLQGRTLSHSKEVFQQEYKLQEDEQELLLEGWTLVQDRIEWGEWLNLYQIIKAHLLVVTEPHPLVQYASKILPSLNHDEIVQCWSILKEPLELKPCGQENIFLALSQGIQDECQPLYVGIILFDPFNERHRYPKHSCLPCAGLAPSPTIVNLVATFDLAMKEQPTISYVDTALPHADRRKELHMKFGPLFECSCTLCQSEENDETSFSFEDRARIGHFAFQQNKYSRALQFYHAAVDATYQGRGDVLHAIGGIFLAQNRFLTAQRHWRDCAKQIRHPGIDLQLEKQRAFRYFDNRRAGNHPIVTYESMFDGQCFLTNEVVVTSDACQNVILWAEAACNWTKNRHYAVPTNDVPIHQVPKLLDWFNRWMEETIFPLLGVQFDVNPNDFFVHDAFIVRYIGQQTTNHLPVHVDESTHSLVLALNDDFSGGGTYFVDYSSSIVPKVPGTLLSFRGDSLRHGGNMVTDGMRYILAAFLYHDTSRKKRERPNLTFAPMVSKKKEVSGFSFDFDI
jgi:hypothetical protein